MTISVARGPDRATTMDMRNVVAEITDRQWEQITGVKINRAAERRAFAAERARLIEALGWAPEDGTSAGRYVATNAELEATLADR